MAGRRKEGKGREGKGGEGRVATNGVVDEAGIRHKRQGGTEQVVMTA